MQINEKTKADLCLIENDWMMTGGERMALIGILKMFEPASVLEFGCRFGGATKWMSELSHEVVTVDIDSNCEKYISHLDNVRFLNMTTQEAASLLRKEEKKFDMVFVDADHTYAGVYKDLLDAFQLGDIILFHDAYMTACRKGAKKALKNTNYFYDLDFVPGYLQANGLWGGLGIVIPKFTRKEKYIADPRFPVHGLLRLISIFRNPVDIFSNTMLAKKIKRLIRL
ncbi:MAG: class I SAM-dependent methyltransferase [Fibrobacteria bacterium]|nr:class I SAM-dependent methyltransferase [Fibrobacteria bacterium]